MVAFYFLLYITSYSQLLGSDRILLAMCGPYSMINILHSMLNTSILTELKLILIAKLSKQKVPSVSKRLSTLFSIGQKRNAFDVHKKVVVDYSKQTRSIQVVEVKDTLQIKM